MPRRGGCRFRVEDYLCLAFVISLGVLGGAFLSGTASGRESVHQPPEISFTTSTSELGIGVKIDQQTIHLNKSRELTLTTDHRPKRIELVLEPGMTAIVGTKTTYNIDRVHWYTFAFGVTCLVWGMALFSYTDKDEIEEDVEATEKPQSISQTKKTFNNPNNHTVKADAASVFPDVQLSIDLSRQVDV